MNASTFDFLFNGDYWRWSNYDSFPHRILEHLQYSAVALAIAFVIAFPIGLLIGHTNRGSFLAINAGNAGRALPTLGVLMLVLALVGTGLVPVTVALVILAIPPILTTTYAGIRSVSGDTVDAARGVGMREWQIVTSVELPIALPIVFGGVRNAVLQVISTATIAAYVGLGGLGRYLFDGLALYDYPRIVAGSVLVALLAVVIDLLLGLVQRLVVSPGVDGRAAKGRRRRRTGGDPATSVLLVAREEVAQPAS
jgi:osmoprotectant transport system permease protein